MSPERLIPRTESKSLKSWIENAPSPRRIMHLYGSAGSGKTICLQKSSQQLGGNCLYINLEHAINLQNIILNLRNQLTNHIPDLPPERDWIGKPFASQINYLINQITKHTHASHFAILIDHADRIHPDTAKAVNDTLLTPLLRAAMPVILSSRTSTVTCNPAIQSQLLSSSSTEMGSLSSSQAREQTNHLNQPRILEDLETFGYHGEHPKFNYLVCTSLNRLPHKDLKSIISQSAQEILTQPTYINRLTIEQMIHLRDISILRYPNTLQIREFLNTLSPTSNWTDRSVHKNVILPLRNECHLVQILDDYEIGPSLKAVLHAWMCAEEGPDAIAKRHQTAAAMFEKFAKTAPHKTQFATEAAYHQQAAGL